MGAETIPPEALWMYSRCRLPVTQRTPWPKMRPVGEFDGPVRKTERAEGFSPVEVKWTVSLDNEAFPVDVMTAPPVAAELSQPRLSPGGFCGFPHGQGITPLVPGA